MVDRETTPLFLVGHSSVFGFIHPVFLLFKKKKISGLWLPFDKTQKTGTNRKEEKRVKICLLFGILLCVTASGDQMP